MTKTSQISSIKKLGLIAGGGVLPGILLQACEARDTEVFVVGFRDHTNPSLLEGRDHYLTRLGAGGAILRKLKEKDIRDLVFIGAVRRPSLTELRPDWRTARFFLGRGLQALGDDGLLKALREELEGEGFTIHAVQDFVPDLLAKEGALGRIKPNGADQDSIQRGIDICRTLGPLDIGQAVIVQEGLVLGIEAAEGTEELIRRCTAYKRNGKGGVLVKLAKPGQDTALDLPTIGPDTVRLCAEAGLSGIAVEAGRSLMPEADKVIALADEAGLFVTGI